MLAAFAAPEAPPSTCEAPTKLISFIARSEPWFARAERPDDDLKAESNQTPKAPVEPESLEAPAVADTERRADE
jgi:hypothetical protein